jgi:ABC-2 type transport system permease protein
MLIALKSVLGRELKKTFRQKSRLLASLVRPLIWLFVIGGGSAQSCQVKRREIIKTQLFLEFWV